MSKHGITVEMTGRAQVRPLHDPYKVRATRAVVHAFMHHYVNNRPVMLARTNFYDYALAQMTVWVFDKLWRKHRACPPTQRVYQ